MDVINLPCPQCGVMPGDRCINYKGKPCAPHAKRNEGQYRPTKKARPRKKPAGPTYVQGSLFPAKGSES